MEVDLGRRLVFPDIVKTTLRPDIVLWSKTWKKLIVIELIVLWETRFEEKERKQSSPSLWTFADSDGSVPGCSPLK